MSSAASGGSLTVAAQLGKYGLQAVGIVVLARLLTPQEYGLIAVVMVVVGLGDLVRDMGLTYAAVQARNISQQQKSNLFWINLAIGIILAIILFFIGPFIGLIFAYSEMSWIAASLSITFVLKAAQAQSQAELVRNLRFFALGASDVVAVALGVAAAIALALMGHGLLALVMQQIVTAVVLMVSRVCAARWVPSWPGKAPMRDLLRFGGNLVAMQMVVYASSNVDTVVMANSFGAVQTGYYNRAFQLASLPTGQAVGPLTSVILPHTAPSQADPEAVGRKIWVAQSSILYTIVFAAFMAVPAADALVLILLGPLWEPAIAYFQILIIAGAVQALGYTNYWAFLVRGKTGANFRYSLVSRPIVIASVVIAGMIAPIAVPLAYLVSLFLVWPLAAVWAERATGVKTLGLWLRAMGHFFVFSIGAVFGLVMKSWLLLTMNSVIAASLVSMCGATAIVTLLVLCIPFCRRDLRLFSSQLRRLIDSRKNVNE